MTPLRSITAYNGWLILEYSEIVEGKLRPRFAVQHPPDGPIQAGKSLREAKQAIDGRPKSRMKGSWQGHSKQPEQTAKTEAADL
jgi:hypothetical protein